MAFLWNLFDFTFVLLTLFEEYSPCVQGRRFRDGQTERVAKRRITLVKVNFVWWLSILSNDDWGQRSMRIVYLLSQF